MKGNTVTVCMIHFSYGGMLSAYMRFKYPNMVKGSIAASAPIYLLTQSVNRSFFFEAVTKDFAMATPQCEEKVRRAFILMMNTATEGASGNFAYAYFFVQGTVCRTRCLMV